MANLEENQRNTELAIAEHHVLLIDALNDLESSTVDLQSQIEATELLSINDARMGAQFQIADIEDSTTEAAANIRSAVITQEANYRGQAEVLIAGYQATNIATEAAYQIATTQGETLAETGYLGSEATIRAATTSGIAAAQQGNISSEAAIDAERYRALARVQVSEVSTRATLESGGELAVANIQAGATRTDADIRATTTTSIATAEVSGISSEASIDATLTASLAALEVLYIDADSAAQTRSIRGAADARAVGTTTSADLSATATGRKAAVEAQSLTDIAAVRQDMDVYASNKRSTASRDEADDSYTGTLYVADKQYSAGVYRADRQYTGTIYTSDLSKQSRMYVADKDSLRTVDLATLNKATDISLADSRYTEEKTQEDSKNSVLNAELAWRLSGWNTLLPKWTASSTVPSTPSTPGYSQSPPSVSRRSPSTRSHVDRKINQRFGQAAHAAESRLRSAQSDSGGRGCGSWSPGVEVVRLSSSVERVKAQSQAWAEEWARGASANATALAESQSTAANLVSQRNRQAIESEAAWVRRNVDLLGHAAAAVK